MDAGRKRELEEKVYAGERLTREDGLALYESDDLVWLGRLAHHRRTELNGDRAMFVVNCRLDPTGDVAGKARESADDQLVELHIVTDPHPVLPWNAYPKAVRELRAALPDVQLKAFTATQLHWFETADGRPADELLDELVEAGLDSLGGGDAEIFDPELRQRLVDHGCRWEDWSRIHRLAHAKGLRTSGTMRYGHFEQPWHRVDHVLRLRDLQDETCGFSAFVPLCHQIDSAGSENGTISDRLGAQATTASPAESLKTFAVSRLLVDNVPHLTCGWAAHGSALAQLSLSFGADDLGGPVVEDPHVADRVAAPSTHRAELLNLIWDAGFRPAERDTRYNVVREYDTPTPLAQRRAEPQQIWA